MKYIINLITKYQNKTIEKETLNKQLLLNAIYTYNHLNKQNKKNKKIKEEQKDIYQSFFKREQEQEERDKQLMSTIKDRVSLKIVQESIKEHRENLIKKLSLGKNAKVFPDQTFDSYIPPKNIALSLNIYENNIVQKNLHDTNIKINYLNPNNNSKEKMIFIDFIEPSYNEDISSDINNENDNFLEMINEVDDDILLYDEKLEKYEKESLVNTWAKSLKKKEIINDFEELKQKMSKKNTYKHGIYDIMKKKNKIGRKEMAKYLKSNNNILYNEMSLKNHFHEFTDYLSEKSYNMYINKMNYSYLILMLLSFFDFEKFSNTYEFYDESKILIIFMKKILLFCGISNSKIFELLINKVKNIKEEITFEKYLNIFMSILELSEKFQFYKYSFLLFLVKKNGDNIISMNNYRLFCDLVKGKLIYESDTCVDIIGKMLPIMKDKYPKDDLDNLNYQHVSILLEFLVNYEYGEPE
jgi:hypothetical protein